MKPRFGCAGLVSGVALAACLAVPALADDRRALVVAATEAERDAAVAMSQALLGLGFDVTRLESPETDDLDDALASLSASEGPTVYYSGGTMADLGALAVNGSGPRFVFLDSCDMELPVVPKNVLAVTRAGCDVAISEVLLDQITVPGLPTDQWVLGEGISMTSTLADPFVFRIPTSDVRLTADDYAMLETLSPAARDQMIGLWRKAGIAVDAAHSGSGVIQPAVDTVRVAPVASVAPLAVVTPVTTRVSGAVSPVVDSVSVVSRPQASAPSAFAPGEGLPQPSILVGYVVENLPNAPLVPNEPVAGAAFGTDDVIAREALRAQDATVFAGLVETGAFDPLEDDVTRALQVELARINCYTSGIDGAWGPGSERALLAFYEEIGAVPPGTEADLAAFRDVIARDDIRCPDVAPPPQAVAVSQPVAAQAPAQSSRAAAPVAQPARAAPAPAPQPASNRRSISQTGGTGVFR